MAILRGGRVSSNVVSKMGRTDEMNPGKERAVKDGGVADKSPAYSGGVANSGTGFKGGKMPKTERY